ncbi:hypothetical protein PIB30_022682 [Stylosanthes scabra]|uniref:TIR domain-containing protein n=1 Tax=Stylosanthes scabra TaxID=79078 RepID=A0ABU6W9C1_9FABA|nr:hypothetical protein [Stylosanthes scabra]
MELFDLITLASIACSLLIFVITFLFLLQGLHRSMLENLQPLLSLLGRRPCLPCSSVDSDNHESNSHQITPSSVPFDISHAPQIKYDVFISFRGSDTRHGFVSHLHKALETQKGVETYIDYKLREGDELSSAFYSAIEQSQIALVILSKDYASSKWCLDELAKIIECMKKYGQIVIPIFYKVDPSDVRHQRGCYENALTKYEERFKGNIMNVEKWRSALKDVANLSGFHSTHFGTDAELMEKVVQRVLNRLNHMHQFDLHGLVGISKPIADLQSLIFCNGTKEIHVVGIWGMGGIGKTTIAGALFHTLCSEYENCYFLANVREQIEKYGMLQLRNNLLCILLEDKDLDAGVPNVALTHVLSRLRRKKILVVLDDVINPDQVSQLVGGRGQHGWLGPGSRIIVTTRDKHVLRKEADDIYEVKALTFYESLQLLTLHAFDGNDIPEGYNYLMVEVVHYAEGVPLALKVLGSFLYGKSVEEWRSQLDKLRKMPFEGIQKVLRLSYDGLDRHEKKILLYIVCFFTCQDVKSDCFGHDVKMLLDACGFSTTIALRTLQDRSLITINFLGRLYVHDLIRQMCQEIVCEEKSEKPGERHHLWDPNDIYHVLKYDKGTDSIKSISLDISEINDLNLTPYAFASMLNLKFLSISGFITGFGRLYNPVSRLEFDNPVHALQDHIILLPNNLRLLHWDCCPFRSLPPKLENLVELHMRYSSLEKLWDSTQNLPNLRKVYLCHSKQLKEVPDLSKAVSLEELNLESCENLVSVHPSIFSLPKLVKLNLSYYKRFKRLPDLSKALSLEELNLNSCENLVSVHPSVFSLPKLVKLDMRNCKMLERLPGVLDEEASASPSASSSLSSNLQYLDLSECVNLKHLPDTFYKLTSLQQLHLFGCKELDTSNLHILFDGLSSLTWLEMGGCHKLYEVPENITNLSLLEWLGLDETNVKSVPESIKHLPHLKHLNLRNCKKLESLPHLMDNCILSERVFTPTPKLLQQHLAHFQSFLQESDRYCDPIYFLFYGNGAPFTLINCPKLERDAIDAIRKYSECCRKGRTEMSKSKRTPPW